MAPLLEGCHIAAIFVLISVGDTGETIASLYLMSEPGSSPPLCIINSTSEAESNKTAVGDAFW